MRLAFAIAILSCSAAVSAAEPATVNYAARVRGPEQLPRMLKGKWRITLCATRNHCWLRFDNVKTGAVHVVARYRTGFGESKDKETGEVVVPKVKQSGVFFDQDLHYELTAFDDRTHHHLVCVMENPPIFTDGNARGYHSLWNNCSTYGRNAWAFYTGRKLPLLFPHHPSDLVGAIIKARRAGQIR